MGKWFGLFLLGIFLPSVFACNERLGSKWSVAEVRAGNIPEFRRAVPEDYRTFSRFSKRRHIELSAIWEEPFHMAAYVRTRKGVRVWCGEESEVFEAVAALEGVVDLALVARKRIELDPWLERFPKGSLFVLRDAAGEIVTRFDRALDVISVGYQSKKGRGFLGHLRLDRPKYLS